MSTRPRHRDPTQRVVITGVGAVTPLGGNVADTWGGLLRGRTGFGPITWFDARTFSTSFAAEAVIPDLAEIFADPSPHEGAGRNTRFALSAAAQAWRQAGLGDSRTGVGPPTPLDRARVGMYLGSGEGVLDFENYVKSNLGGWDAGARKIDPARWAAAAHEHMDATRELEQESNMTLAQVAEARGTPPEETAIDLTNNNTSEFRVVRGGSWNNTSSNLQSSNRNVPNLSCSTSWVFESPERRQPLRWSPSRPRSSRCG